MNVGDILSNDVHIRPQVSPDQCVLEIIKLMNQNSWGAVAVVSDGRLLGLFSERDFTKKVLLAQRPADSTPVRDVMTQDLLTVSPDISAEECLSKMNRRGVRHLPVVTNGQFAGLVSILDVVDAVLHQRQRMINHLERYVSETWPI